MYFSHLTHPQLKSLLVLSKALHQINLKFKQQNNIGHSSNSSQTIYPFYIQVIEFQKITHKITIPHLGILY